MSVCVCMCVCVCVCVCGIAWYVNACMCGSDIFCSKQASTKHARHAHRGALRCVFPACLPVCNHVHASSCVGGSKTTKRTGKRTTNPTAFQRYSKEEQKRRQEGTCKRTTNPTAFQRYSKTEQKKENNPTKPLSVKVRLIVAAHACFWSNRLTTGVLEVCEWHLAKKNSKPAIPSMPVALTKQLQEL